MARHTQEVHRRETAGVSKQDVIRLAFARYHRREITLPELLRVLAQWRPR